MRYRYLAIVLMFLGSHVFAEPLSLSVKQIKKDLAADVVDIKVLELHESSEDKAVEVVYTGIPLQKLLQYLYPKTWQDFDGEIYFYALDGYLSILGAGKARQGEAYMTFARADGKAFTIDNRNRNEKDVPLAPFYLVWDNLNNPLLRTSNAYSWPYQLYQTELVPETIVQSLLPPNASAQVEAGFDAFRDNCLSCHNINGFGGKKYGMDVRQVIKALSREELYEWIDKPSAINKYTAMPPLAPGITGENRQRTINSIIDYLQAI